MSWSRQFLLWLIGLGAVAVVIWVSVSGGGDGTSGLDRKSYLAGYHDSFEDAYVPKSDEDRKTDEARCDELLTHFPSTEIAGRDRHSWVVGCADFVEGKKPRF